MLPTPGLSNPGLPVTTITRVVLVPEEAAKRAIVPVSAEEVGDGWKSEVAFDDASWLSASGAPGGVGYERSSGYESLISLDVEEPMYGQNNTCYVRIPFRVEGDLVGSLSELQVRVRYDDGFVLYLNGTEVARTNFSGTPQWDSRAESSHEASSQAFDAVLDLSDQIGLLRAGENLLAVQGLNTSSTSSDFVISVALEGAIVEVEGQVYPYEKELALLDGLRIMELMYHAEEGDGSDYIELQNILDEPLDVTGVRFTDGVTFTFPPMILGAGEYVVVVDDQAAFRSRYGTALTIAGAYSGHLSDRGEDIVLKLASPLEAAIMRFRYEDGWYPATDGRGRSLSIEDPTAAAVIWNDPENWRASDPTPGGP
jgi:hypothetical protein